MTQTLDRSPGILSAPHLVTEIPGPLAHQRKTVISVGLKRILLHRAGEEVPRGLEPTQFEQRESHVDLDLRNFRFALDCICHNGFMLCATATFAGSSSADDKFIHFNPPG